MERRQGYTTAMEPPCTLGYMDVPWLQRHRLVYMGFVHCGGAFQMPCTMVQMPMNTSDPSPLARTLQQRIHCQVFTTGLTENFFLQAREPPHKHTDILLMGVHPIVPRVPPLGGYSCSRAITTKPITLLPWQTL